MKNICWVISSLLVSLMLFSCGSTRKNAKVDELILIKTASEQGNIMFLIDALNKYPLYRGYTESYLYEKDFSKESYGRIKRYAEAARNDVDATLFFDSLLLNRRVITIDSLSSLSISEVGEYYRTNGKEHDYLRDILCDSYFADIESLDYGNRRELYRAFKGTDLLSVIEQPYKELRDSLWAEIMDVLIPYFKSEREVLKQIEEVVRYESQMYVESGVEKIIISANEKNDRGLFKKIFKREAMDNYSFKEYVNNVINDTYDYSYIENLTKDRLSEYIISSNQLRSMLFNQYFSDSNYENIYMSDSVLNNRLVWVIGREDIDEIQSIKNTSTALTVGSLAMGFVPGVGTIAIAADVIDLAYGLRQEGQITQATEQMASTIYNDSSRCIGSYLKDIFDEMTDAQKVTERNILKIFNDEF